MDNINVSHLSQAAILVVDDEQTNLLLMEKMLSGAGYKQVHTCQNPEQVEEILISNAYDLLILDLNMPRLDGFTLMERLRELDIALPPILVLTAQQASEHRHRALTNGARDYLTKPMDRLELLARVANLIEAHLAQRHIQEQNDLLETKVRMRTDELYQTRLQIVQRLGRAAEYRDNETGLHIIRMSKISAALGRAAGLEQEQCDLILNASPMHDIGKIGIPDHILLKPGKFEPDEWEIMQTHAQIGADILADDDSELLRMARDIALCHHEKWDGTGYPNQLKGEAIPLTARIVSLADVFDALTAVRPYKQAWPVEKAVKLIREESGKHFDPDLVEHFLGILPEIIGIKNRYAEPEQAEAKSA